jgi:hypothetical protein
MVTPELLDRILSSNCPLIVDARTKDECRRVHLASKFVRPPEPFPGQDLRQWRLDYLERLIDIAQAVRDSERRFAERN